MGPGGWAPRLPWRSVTVLLALGCRCAGECDKEAYVAFFREVRDHYRDCEEAGGGSNGSGCLPARVSHPLVMQAMDLVDEEVDEAAMQEQGLTLTAFGGECQDGLLAALAVFARPMVHTPRGQWAARTAFALASRGCWPTLGVVRGGWPVTYDEVLQLVLDAEAWEEYGEEAEYRRPPMRPMPQPLLHALTPARPLPAGEPPGGGAGEATSPRRLHVLSTGHHASYPAAIVSLWRAAVPAYEFELEDHSFDTRYCDLAGTCSVDERFAWLGERLRGTVVETCGGLYLKGFEDIAGMAEELFQLLTQGDALATRADVLLCTHPPYSCRLFWPFVQRLGKPLIGFFGGTLEAHVPSEGMLQWLRDFREMATHPRVQFAAIAPFLAEKMRYQTGVDIPSARGFGFHLLEQGAVYFPRRLHEVLVWKNSNECDDNQADFDAVLAELDGRAAAREAEAGGDLPALRFRHLRPLRAEGGSSYANIASFRAAIFAPYEVLLMTFYELYHVGIPLFLPHAGLASFLMYRGPVTYPHCDMVLPEEERGAALRPRAPYSPFVRDRVTDRQAWLEAYTDWYRFPHLQRFASLAELVAGLRGADLQAISAGMRRESEGALAGAAEFWGRAFAKVLGASVP